MLKSLTVHNVIMEYSPGACGRKVWAVSVEAGGMDAGIGALHEGSMGGVDKERGRTHSVGKGGSLTISRRSLAVRDPQVWRSTTGSPTT